MEVRNSIVLEDGMTPALEKLGNNLSVFTGKAVGFESAINRTNASTANAKKPLINLFAGLKDADEQATKNKISCSNLSLKLIGLNAAISLARQGFALFKAGADIADEFTNISARINLVVSNAELVPSTLNDIRAAAAEARTPFTEMADIIGKLGVQAKETFNGNIADITKFASTLQKGFIVGGSDTQSAQAASRQLVQAMGSGRLQGDEFRSIMENAPLVAQAIAKSMGKSIGDLKKLSTEGKITAAEVKKAMIDGSDDIDAAFQKMPITFAQAWALGIDKAKQAAQPLIDKFNEWMNGGGAEKIQAVLESIGSTMSWIYTNARRIGIVLAGAGAIAAIGWGVYNVALKKNASELLLSKVAAIIVGWEHFKAGIKAAAGWMVANAQILLTWGSLMLGIAIFVVLIAFWDKLGAVGRTVCMVLTAALLMVWLGGVLGPVGWVIGAILVLAAGFVALFTQFKDAAMAAVGAVVGAVFWLGAQIQNAGILIENAWNTVWYNIKSFCRDTIESILKMLKPMLTAFDALAGTHTADIIGTVSTKLNDWVGTEPVKKEYVDANAAFAEGQAIGSEWAGKVSDWMNEKIDKGKESLENAKNGLTGGTTPAGTDEDPVSTSVTGDVSISEEDLKYLRDMGTIKLVNKITTLRPMFNATFGDVNQVNPDGVGDYLVTSVEQALASALR
ncbi:MAG: tape measure protein [Clostridium sp.]|jgi:tape measure domain-containing protein|nr:tape measure protein [Clostridium sp.]